MHKLPDLSPKDLWKHFLEICKIPRPSKHEIAVRTHIQTFATRKKLKYLIDDTGNLIIYKNPSLGMDNRQTVILQSHLDMVPQKNADVVHDFTKDPIRPYIDHDWITAEGTTLGADNGIGLAAIMAILESTHLSHGPIEALLTVDEESGMSGAKGLNRKALTGSILLNLDTEDEGELYVGCAGGIDLSIHTQYKTHDTIEGDKTFNIALRGLKGGHSGLDIHLGRGNANKLMTRFLKKASIKNKLGVVQIIGGTMRNAIPRECFATVVVPAADEKALFHTKQLFEDDITHEIGAIESNFTISIEPTEDAPSVMSKPAQQALLNALYACPNDVMRMSHSISNMVDTSTNLGILRVKDGIIQIVCMVRSLTESSGEDVAEAISSTFELINATIDKETQYPGWSPNTDSQILTTMTHVYKELFGIPPKTKVIHAGLECGLLANHYPHCDMISFGPTIRNAHSPDEKVHINSVHKFWELLVATLKAIPEKN